MNTSMFENRAEAFFLALAAIQSLQLSDTPQRSQNREAGVGIMNRTPDGSHGGMRRTRTPELERFLAARARKRNRKPIHINSKTLEKRKQSLHGTPLRTLANIVRRTDAVNHMATSNSTSAFISGILSSEIECYSVLPKTVLCNAETRP